MEYGIDVRAYLEHARAILNRAMHDLEARVFERELRVVNERSDSISASE
jgi:hypothetical protein